MARSEWGKVGLFRRLRYTSVPNFPSAFPNDVYPLAEQGRIGVSITSSVYRLGIFLVLGCCLIMGLVTTLNGSGSGEAWEFSSTEMVKGNEEQSLRHEVENEERIETMTEDIIEQDNGSLGFVASNVYIEMYGIIGCEYPWTSSETVIVDVGIPYTITLVFGGDIIRYKDYSNAFEVKLDDIIADPVEGPDGSLQFISLSNVTCSIPLSITETATGAEVTGFILVKNVKREARDLLDEDWETFVDALHQMWVLSQDEGIEIYGPDFISGRRLGEIHISNSNNGMLDAFHEGQGFVSQHLKLDRLTQKSLTSINPSITLPYWDWTVDQLEYSSGVAETVWAANSRLWSSSGFGSPPTANSSSVFSSSNTIDLELLAEFSIRDGFWAGTKVPNIDVTEPFPRNSYGFLRSPWNNNPSPYVTREMAPDSVLPECNATFDIIYNVTDYPSFVFGIARDPHAYIHKTIGGYFLDNASWSEVDDKIIEIAAALDPRVLSCKVETAATRDWRGHMISTLFEKLLYMSHTAEYSGDTCDPLSGEFCNWFCPPERLSTVGRMAMADCSLHGISEDVDESMYEELGSLICSLATFPGDHAAGGSAYDPSFFVIHGTVQRYYHYKQLTTPVELDWLNASSACFPEAGSCYTGFNETIDDDDICCSGHLQFSQYYSDGTVLNMEGLTNQAIMEIVDPLNPDVDTVFHHLNWSHCPTWVPVSTF